MDPGVLYRGPLPPPILTVLALYILLPFIVFRKYIIFFDYVGFLDTFLLFRTHHLRNYITEVTLIVRKISYFKIHVNIRDFSIFCREATCQYRRPG